VTTLIRYAMRAAAFASLAGLYGVAALAQQAPAAAPASAAASPAPIPGVVPPNYPLAPHAPGLTAKPVADIAINRLKLPPGFQAEVWASGIPNARTMAFGDKGTVFVGSRFVGSVYAVVDQGGQRKVYTIAKDLHRPNGVAFKDGTLYIAELSRITKIENIESKLENPGAPVPVYTDLPKDEAHGWKYLRLGPDGKLYFQVGAPGNIVMPNFWTHAQITRINTDGSGREIVATGVRNSVGFDWDPKTKDLWFTDNGRDIMGEDKPHDELNHLSKQGQHFGFPYCHQGDLPDPDFHANRKCSEFTSPVSKLGPHVAALGMSFYTGSMFPREYANKIFIARHGSWDRSERNGVDIVTIDPSAKDPQPVVFASGWLADDKKSHFGRPADVKVMKDGSLLVSDDTAGALIRISYKK
jgi:glucose/arabinose dehydrogenase